MSANQQRTGFIDSGSNGKPAAAWKAAVRLRVALFLLSASISSQVFAAEKAFTVSGANLTLEDVSSEVEVRYRSMRLNRAQNVWNVEALLTNRSSRVIQGPFVLFVENFTGTTGPQQADGSDDSTPARAFFDLSANAGDGALSPGEITLPRTLTLGVGTGAPSLVTRAFAAPNRSGVALALVRSLNAVGQPLTGVQVEEVGPVGPTNTVTDPVFGIATVGQGSGAHLWKFSASGYLPVWRQQSLSTGEVAVITSPRLTRRGTNTATITLLDGGQARDAGGAIQINFPAGAVTQNTTATLTPLTGQTLPALLPLGWSSLRAFWLELSGPVSTPAAASLRPSGPIGNVETAALARLNENTLQWEVTQLLTGNGTNAITATLNGGGAFALVAGDFAPIAPPAPQLGQALQASSVIVPDLASLTATGQVNPSSSPASRAPELVTATAAVILSHPSDALPSGVVLRGEVIENYRLSDGTRHPPQYENFVIGYQRPGDASASTLQAEFPMRPVFLFGSEELEEATVKVDVLTPTLFAGSILDSRGGQVTGDALRVLAGGGDVVGNQAAQLRRLNPTNFLDLVPTNVTIVAAFDLTMSGVALDRRLVAQITGAPTNSLFVLARVLYDQGRYGLQPLERLTADALGRLATAEPVSGDRLDGIVGAGQYLLLRVTGRQALVTGLTRNSAGQPTGGMPVRISGQPWLAFSRADGSFKLLAPTGNVEVAVTDPTTGDTGNTTFIVSDPNVTANTSLASAAAGPRVVSINPTNGAANVSRVTPIEIAFSEPVNPATLLGNAIQVFGTNGLPVAASLTLNLRSTVATLLPTEQLAASAVHSILLSTNIADLTGLKLEGANTFNFTTESDRLNRLVARVISHEPDTNGFAAMVGSAGIAEPEAPVILVNETTGATAAVLSKPDGSFSNAIPAAVDDFLSAVIVNRNGTRNTIPVSRQIFRDGSVGLFNGGGILEAQSDGGPVQILVEPGAIPGKTKFKVELFSLTELLASVGNTAPAEGTLVGRGVRIQAEGDKLVGPIDISVPVSQAELEQAGLTNGSSPAEAVYALVTPTTVEGDPAYMLLDKMQFENGRLVTHSEPFPGADLLLRDKPTATQEAEAARSIIFASARPLAPGGNEAILNLGVAPLLLASKTQPVIFTGKVLEKFANDQGIVVGVRPVVGALVTVRPVGGPRDGARSGRLEPGEIYTLSRANGAYALMRPHSEFGGPVDPSGPRDEFLLAAQHPLRFGDRAFAAASAQAAVLRLADLIFEAVLFRPTQDPGPPALHIFHSPLNPRSGTEARITVLATHGSELPSIDPPTCAGVVSLVGEDVSCGDVHVFPGVEDSRGPTSLRMTFPVRCDKANVQVTLRFRARMSAVPDGFALYSIQFRDSDDVIPHPPPSDVNDRVGPRVVRSTPSDDRRQLAPTLAAGDPILIEFNEPILAAPEVAVELDPPAGRPILELSPNQRFLTIQYYNLKPDKKYVLRLTPAITDLRDNRLDQDPLTPSPDDFFLRFRTAPAPSAVLTGIDSGGGVVMRGTYSFSLDRTGPLDGAVVVHDLSNPGTPVATFSVPGFPRDLALIPRYSYVKRPGDLPLTNDLLAVVGGKVGAAVDEFGNLSSGFQYLWIIDISDPRNPQRLAAAAVTLSPVTAVTKVQWSPPYLAYLEFGPDAQTINLVNLQSFILGSHLSPSEFGNEINPGVDANGDGDFVDAALGDRLPIPDRDGSAFSGKENTFAVPDTNQKILDFHFDRLSAYLGVTLAPGRVLDPSTGLPGDQVPAAYRTLLQGNILLSRETASFPMNAGATPKRLFAVFNARLRDASGQERAANLALVSVIPDSGTGASRIDVIEITDPTSPRLLQSISIPEQHGLVQSMFQRADGQILVAASEDVLLLDPSRLAEPTPINHPHPALTGVISGMGSGARSFDSSIAGLHVVNLGGKHVLKQTAPQIFFVVAPELVFEGQESILDPQEVVNQPERATRLLATMRPIDVLSPAAFRTVPGILLSGLNPPDRLLHYHVVVVAPGWAGDTIEVALESLNESLAPLHNKGLGFAPVRAMSDPALSAIGQRPIDQIDATIRTLTAYQLETENKADPNYNVYLSKPFALTVEPMTKDDLALLKTPIDREILWSGHFLRAYLDHSMELNAAVGPFVGFADLPDAVIRPGVMAVARSYPGDYTFGPNPRRVKNKNSAPGSFRSVALNGGFENETVDISLPSPRIPIVFKRSIRGQDLFVGPFGRGWDFNYNQRFVRVDPEMFPGAPSGGGASIIGVPPLVLPKPGNAQDPRNQIPKAQDTLFYDGEGNTHLYHFVGTAPPDFVRNDPLVLQLDWASKASAFYRSPPGAFDLVVRFKDERFARLLPDGTQFWYSPQGRLETIYDRYTNNVHVLRYNFRGELIRIEDQSVDAARYLDIGYYRTQFEPLSSPADERTPNLTLLGRIHRLKDYAGREVIFTYDPSGLLLIRRDGIQVSSGLEPGSNSRQRTHYTYGLGGGVSGDSLDALREFPLANNISGIIGGDPGGAPLVAATEYKAGAPVPVIKKFEGANGPVSLDVFHDNTAESLAAGNAQVRTSTQDGAANLYTLDELGLPQTTEMSGSGAPAVTYKTFHNEEGLPTRIAYPLGNEVRFFYETASPNRRSGANLRALERHPHGGGPVLRADFAYAEKYNLRAGVQTDFNGNPINHILASDERDVGEIVYPDVAVGLPPGVSASFPIGRGGRETFQYNAYGQLERHQDVNGIVRQFTYLADNGFLQTFVLGEQDENLTTTFVYPAGTQGLLGLPGTRISPRGTGAAPTTLTYNEREQLVSVERGPLRSTFFYDVNGRLRRRTSQVDANKQLVETLEYEHNGFLRRRTLYDVETASSTFGAPAVGPRNLTVEYEPDEMFRVQKIINNPGTPEEVVKEFINFDHLGRPERMKFGNYEENYTYDDNGNAQTVRRGNATTQYVYDGHDRLKDEIHPVDGTKTETVNRVYFNSGELREITVTDADNNVNRHATFKIDALGRPVVATTDADTGVAVDINGYDAAARRRRTQSPQGEVSEISYEDNSRPKETSDSVRSVEFTHDRNSNTEKTISKEGPGGQTRYSTQHTPFDQLDRSRELTDDEGRVSSLDYRVDGQVAGITDARNLGHDFEYTLLGEPTLRRLPSGVEFHFSYDSHRQPRLEGDRFDEGWKYGYDSTLRLERHALRDGKTSRFSQFDARNRPARTEFPEAQPELTVNSDYDRQGRLLASTVSYLGQNRQDTSSYDALDRIKTNTFTSSGITGKLVYRYNLLGPPSEVSYEMLNHTFDLHFDVRIDGVRTNVVYPSNVPVVETRDLHGRKLAVLPQSADPAVATTDFAAADLIGRQTFGPGLIICENAFDLRKRLLHRKYVRNSDNKVLAELRYAYDPNNNVVARQSLHRAGRTDFFSYDVNDRLTRADLGVHPPIVGAALRQLSNFAAPTNVLPANVQWAAGFFAREYSYDSQELDLLVAATDVNPDNLALPPFAAVRANFDASLHAGVVGGATRARNSLADTTNTMLQVRVPGNPSPQSVSASLEYDGLGQLVRIVRADGVEISYAYLPGGLCCYRRVSGPTNRCVPSERIFVWDGPRLIEEYDLAAGQRNLRARYYYAESDVPVAADLANAGGTLQRHYFLVDAQGSLLAAANTAGDVVERYSYDAWGQPEIEPNDTQPPVVRRIVSDGGDLLIEFSERVLPLLAQSPAGASDKEFSVSYADFAAGLAVEQAGVAVAGAFTLVESQPGFAYGTVVRFQPAGAVSGNLTLRLQAGALNDEWNNPIITAAIPFAFNPTPGTVLFQNLTATAPTLTGRTVSDQPFLFHGQYFDFDAGLIYMRARFYDPFAGLFLQPDPAGYEDSVNPYAAFSNNPQSMRDPSGEVVVNVALAVVGAGIGSSLKVYHETTSNPDATFRDYLAAGLSGAFEGALAGATLGASTLVEGAVIGAAGAVGGQLIDTGIAEGRIATLGEVTEAGAKGAAFGVGGAVAGKVIGIVAAPVVSGLSKGYSAFVRAADEPIGDLIAAARGGASSRFLAKNADELLEPAETAVAAAKDAQQSAATGATSLPIGKKAIIEGLKGKGYTPDLVSKAIERGEINTFILDDVTFAKQLAFHGGKTQPGFVVNAFQYHENIFLRQSRAATGEIYAHAVHEGRHALDYLRSPTGYRKLDVGAKEIRAWAAENSFRKAIGLPEHQAPLGLHQVLRKSGYDIKLGTRAEVQPWWRRLFE